FIIKPAKAAIKSAKSPKTKQIKVTWKKSAGGVTGYQVTTALDKKFSKSKKSYTVKKAATTSKTITKLKKGKTYYVKVRAYKTVGKTKYYGAYSAAKKVTVK
ncbi:MAG: fibronectin type III domain-containing protein, partial [Ruminococcus sp.]|nr:fibronectin type III domain-containing protein [Ruminococcus sp.]